MSVRPIPTRDLHAIYDHSRWTTANAYRPDPIEALRQSINERETRKDKRSDHIGTVLFILTVVGCVWLIVSGAL